MSDILTAAFYQREDVLQIAQELLGTHLCACIDGELAIGRIVETEAYRAPDDKASHAYGNRRTKRTETMFMPGGVSYVYLCYGIHHLFNVVTGREQQAHAVLIRAVEPIEGIDAMLKRRHMETLSKRLTSGPGCLTVALGIDRSLNGHSLLARQAIWIEDHRPRQGNFEIIKGPRIGVDYAEECAQWPWRFYIKDNPWVSK